MFSTNISHGYDGTHKFEFWKLIRKTNAKEKNEESSPATLIAKKSHVASQIEIIF